MTKIYLSTFLMMAGMAVSMNAQLTSSPSPLQEDSSNATIYFNATGTPLEGKNASVKLYAHTGCDLSNGQTWVNAPTWGDNSSKYELTYVSQNNWSLYLGNIRDYYGITNPDVKITGLDFVIRTADKNTQTSDLWIEVVDSGLQISFTSNATGEILTPETAYVTFNASTTETADISLDVNGTIIASQNNATSLSTSYLFPGSGNYTVTATATANGESVSKSLDYVLMAASQLTDYPGGTPRMGPMNNADGSVTFCIGAPEKNHVMIVGDWNGYEYTDSQVMNYQDVIVQNSEGQSQKNRYFWITINGLDNDRMYGYYFVVDGKYQVGDPYARLVLDPWNDKYLDTGAFGNLPEYPYDKVSTVPVAVYQGSINDYDWQVENFVGVEPENLIIYELLFRDFTGTEGKADGNGTVRKAIEKFDYLKNLGVNAIELLPIMEFNGNISWGYNPNFYFAVDKAYGTPNDYKEFIDLCHQNGIAVILDMVFNQSDGLHPWYQMYDAGKNPFYNLDAPHAYSVLNDWNQGTEMVQEQWADVLRYWMEEYKFDGFRFDLVKGLGNNSSYANSGDAATNAYNQSRIDRMIALQKIVESINPNAYFINENLAGAQEENAMAEYGQLNWANVNEAGCQFAMGYSSDSNLNRMYAPKDSRTWGSTVSYLESHDEQRLAYKQDQWGVEGVKGNAKTSMQRIGSAAAQMFMAPGAHMIWQFSEIGNAQNTKNNDGGNNTDPKIVNWSLYDEPNHRGLYNSYAEMIAIRDKNPDLFSEKAEFTSNCGTNNWANGRTLVSRYGDQEIFTAINPNVTGELTLNFDFSVKDNSQYSIVSKSYNSNPSFNAVAGTITVPANCYVIVARHTLASVEEIIGTEVSPLRAYATDGTIVVDYAPAGVSVFSLDGRVVANFTESGTINVAPGIYILRSGENVIKLMVR